MVFGCKGLCRLPAAVTNNTMGGQMRPSRSCTDCVKVPGPRSVQNEAVNPLWLERLDGVAVKVRCRA